MAELPLRVILDVDTGVDDALALALAVLHPRVQLEAVLTVAGNVGLDITTRNTLRVLDWVDATDVPVATGASGPLSAEVREASHWHGPDGLGGATLPDSGRRALANGVDYLVQRLMAEPGELTLVCVGPLTNLALVVQQQPAIVDAVRSVVVMGGAARPPGNVTPVAEFNIYADPEAANIVFNQPWPLTMVGLDVSNRVQLTRQERVSIGVDTSPAAVLVHEVTRRHFDTLGLDAIALHDPLALLVALDPSLVTTVQTEVVVETHGEHTLGQTVADLRPNRKLSPSRTRVCLDVDVARARALFFDSLGLRPK
jgi:inosine-uridine nucleoside N-ribohydrolase